MRRAFAIIALFSVILAPLACNKASESPTAASPVTYQLPVTFLPNSCDALMYSSLEQQIPSLGVFVQGVVSRVRTEQPPTPVSYNIKAGVVLAVNGNPITNATVVLSGSGNTYSMQYVTSVVNSYGQAAAAYAVPTTTPIVYNPGQAYSIAVTTTGGNVHSSLVLPGDILHSSLLNQSSWSHPGTCNRVLLMRGEGDLFSEINPGFNGIALIGGGYIANNTGWGATSPVNIPSSAFAIVDTYSLNTLLIRADLNPSGAALGSYFLAGDVVSTSYPYPIGTVTPTPIP